MKKDYSVRPYQLGDEEKIVQLLQRVFDGWPSFDLDCSSLDHWRWKYEDNPMKKIIIVVSEAVDGVIGFIHGIPLKMKLGNSVHLCSFGSDVAVNPDFRMMGVHNKMLKLGREVMREAGVEFTYFTSGNPILIKSYSKGYPHITNPINNLVRIRDVNLQLHMIPVESSWLMKLGFHMVKVVNDIRNTINGSKLGDLDVRIHSIHSFDAKIDIFWEKVSDHYNFIVERRKNYLNWRYCDPRAGDFIVNQAEDIVGNILGYCVLRINRYIQDYPIGYLVDLLTLPDRMDVADKLIKEAVHYFDSKEINIINCLAVKNHPYERILKRHGFLDSRKKLHVFYDPLGVDDKLLKKTNTASKIHFSYGDLDSLPIEMPRY